ncbi:hypothetical protein F5Y16DRAFT_85907 [Xylariaceae sp. FL0255]|nr:hypothetical protein F5Y16DRAFT_85907 [Xylariaceae sp. FL0255]
MSETDAESYGTDTESLQSTTKRNLLTPWASHHDDGDLETMSQSDTESSDSDIPLFRCPKRRDLISMIPFGGDSAVPADDGSRVTPGDPPKNETVKKDSKGDHTSQNEPKPDSEDAKPDTAAEESLKPCPLLFDIPIGPGRPYGMTDISILELEDVPGFYTPPLKGTLLEVPIRYAEHIVSENPAYEVAQDMVGRVMFHVINTVFNDERVQSAEDHYRAIREIEPFRFYVIAHDFLSMNLRDRESDRMEALLRQILSLGAGLAHAPDSLPHISWEFWSWINKNTRLEAGLRCYFPTKWPALLDCRPRHAGSWGPAYKPYILSSDMYFGRAFARCTFQQHQCSFTQNPELTLPSIEGLQELVKGQWVINHTLDDFRKLEDFDVTASDSDVSEASTAEGPRDADNQMEESKGPNH